MIFEEVDGLRALRALGMTLVIALGGCGGVVDLKATEVFGSGGGGSSRPSRAVGGSGSTAPASSGASSQLSGAGGGSIHPPVQMGGGSGVGANGCPLPWWGTPLEGVTGLLSCSQPYDPAMLAYGQTEYPSCSSISGPVSQSMVGDNLTCCYSFDDSQCGSAGHYERCVEVPYFGEGTTDAPIPDTIVPFDACDAPEGPKLVVTTQQARAQNLIGVWLRCDQSGASFNGNAIVFRGDGTFQALQADAQGRLAAAPGCNQSGLWGFISNPGQLNLHMGDWSMFWAPQFTGGSPRRLYAGSDSGTEVFVEATASPASP